MFIDIDNETTTSTEITGFLMKYISMYSCLQLVNTCRYFRLITLARNNIDGILSQYFGMRTPLASIFINFERRRPRSGDVRRGHALFYFALLLILLVVCLTSPVPSNEVYRSKLVLFPSLFCTTLLYWTALYTCL